MTNKHSTSSLATRRDPFRRPVLIKASACASAVLAILSFPSGQARAATYFAPLDGLVGPIDFLPGRGSGETSFDFGQQFAEIESVSIEIEASVTAREFDVCGTFFDPQPCMHVVQLLGLFAIMDIEDTPSFLAVFSEGLSFSDNFEDLTGAGVDVGRFNDDVGWGFLLDGKGSLELFWNSAYGNPDRIIRNVIEPGGKIISARLVIQATVIPEPSTATLLGLGLLGFAFQVKRGSGSAR